MYIFSRSRLARPGRIIDAMASSVEVAEKVTQITGIDIFVWATRFGAPVGTISWSCRLETQAELHEATEKLAVDATYVEMAMSMDDQYEGAAEDVLMRVVAGTPAETPAKYYIATTATMANGQMRDAIAWGVGMQEFVSDALDAPGLFGTTAYGGFADVGWLLGHETMADVDAAATWESTNEEYHERLDDAADLFVAGSGHQRLLERLN